MTYPYLKFDPFVLSEDGLDFEINTNSGNKGRSERVVGVAEKEAGLAHRTVANNEELEHVVKVLVGSVFLPSPTLRRHLWTREKEKIEKKPEIDVRLHIEYTV